ncbi:MAG: hypothetical protein ACTSU5_22140 [Promethearchaeota archaeon]
MTMYSPSPGNLQMASAGSLLQGSTVQNLSEVALTVGSLAGLGILAVFAIQVLLGLIFKSKVRLSAGKLLQLFLAFLLVSYCGLSRGVSLLSRVV